MSNSNDPYNQTNFQRSYASEPKKRNSGLGCFVIPGVIVILCAVTALFSGVIGTIQSHPLSIFFQGDFPYGSLGVGILMGAGFIICFVVLKVVGGWPRSRWARLLLILPLLLGFGAGAFWFLFINPNIGMTRTGFIRTSTVDITAGNSVYFRNPADGVVQTLCMGEDQHCKSGDNDPSQLDNGLVIQPGQTVSVKFATAGTYQITSKTTPHMNVTISAGEPGDTSD